MVTKYKQLKQIISDMIQKAESGHYASSMSALEIIYLLFYEQGIKPDQFILSKGHAAPALYAILFDLGYLKQCDIDRFRQYGGLPGHPELGTNGVLCSSGSLGMGISKAIGLAYANPDKQYHVLVGDGELQEGQNWEAIYYIDANDMKNIHIHIDGNWQQYSGLCTNWFVDLMRFPFIQFHRTEWDHDNSYLTKHKNTDIIYLGILYEEMLYNERIIVLNADLEQDFGLTIIKEKFPDRYIQCGISEQHMVSMANGLALAGKIPICHTFSAFYRRTIDQIWNNVCDNLHIGYVAGLTQKSKINIGKSHDPTDPKLFEIIGIYIAKDIYDFFHEITYWPGIYLEI
jgi:transketolase